jgi:argininosuccinate lyase
MTSVNTEKLSSARFAEATDAFVEIFTASVDFDQRMALQDIQGSLAHAQMLCKANKSSKVFNPDSTPFKTKLNKANSSGQSSKKMFT